MSDLLGDFFIMYGQDFDIVFTSDTDPIDLFCEQHSVEEQRQLLGQLENLNTEICAGRKTLSDIRSMGLEYLPDGGRDVNAWLPRFIGHLRSRLDATNGDQCGAD